MEIRKILDILEAAPPQSGAVGMFGKNPNTPAASTAQPATNGKPVVGTGLVAGSETQGGQVSYGAGASAQRTAAPKPAAAAGNTPPAGGTPFTNPTANPTANAAASPAPTAAQPAAPSPQTKTYGGGYDQNKVQYAYGGPSASAQQSAASDASKKNVFGVGAQTAQQPVNNQSSGMTAQSQAQKSPEPVNNQSSGMTAQSQAQKSPEPTPTAAPAQTSDQIATAALNAPAQDTSGTSLGRQAAFMQMAEDELEEDLEEELTEAFNDMLRLSGLPLNEKAVSKQQQKFMGMVHAMQKGEKVKGASPELKKAAKGMSKKDAKDFASTKHKGLPQKVSEGLNLTLDESGHTLNHIVNRFKHEVKKFLNGDMMSENLYDALYDYYLDRGDMPYGVAKAREGDPYAWTVDRFYNDITADGMNEAPVYEMAGDDTLQRLAELAGLSEDGPGAPALYSKDKSTADKMQSSADAVKDFFVKGAETYKDQYMTGLGMPPNKYTPADPRKPFGPRKSEIKEQDLVECGDMGMDMEDILNVSTNMSSDGTRSVNISAQGDQADALLQILKMAGMERSAKPTMVMIDQDEEIVDEAKMKRITRHSNTPDEEYQTVDSIIRQGNDLNREKRQYAGKPKLGDNPMAESILDADLNDILESILIRDDKDSQNPIRLTPKSYDSEKGADWSGYNITSPNTGRIGARMEPGKETEYYAADPLPPDDVTGATIKNHGKDVEWHRGSEVDEGWEDIKTGVSNFFGDMFDTDDSIRRRSGQFRDLEAMQQKYKPGTPEYDQLEMRKNKQKERYYGDKGEVVDKTGEPIKVLPPDQWKGGK